MNPPMSAARFWARVDMTGDCWLWTGGRSSNGYGKLGANRRTVSAHRFAYELTHGAIPVGMFVCHSCDNRLCVRDAHHFLGTSADNMRDMAAKGRSAHGVRNSRARLTPVEVAAIKVAYIPGVITHRELAERYGVCKTAVTHILSRRNWKRA